MASVQVGALGLRLIAPRSLEPRAPALQREAGEVFVPAVLRALERRLARVYGEHAVIRIRRLSIRCALRSRELADGASAEQIGEELAAQIAATVPHPRRGGTAPAHAIAEVYRDAAHLAAVALAAAAERRAGPDGVREAIGQVWKRVCRAPPAERCRILRRCQAAGKLAAVLARLDLPALVALEPIVATGRPATIPVAVRAAIAAKRGGAPAHPSATAMAAPAPPPAGAPPVRTGSPDPAETARPSRRRAARPRKPAAAPAGPSGAATRTAPPSARTEASADARVTPAPDAPVPDGAPRAPASPGHDAGEAAAPTPRPPPREAAIAGEAAEEIAEAWRTGWGPLLFLVNIALRLELPERLWRVGVDEGAALAAAFARLAGDAEDCAPRLLHAGFPAPPPPLPPLPQWARDELAEGVAEAAPRLIGAGGDVAARIALFEAQLSPGGFDLAGWCAAVLLAFAEALLGEPLAPGTIAARFAFPGRIERDGDVIRILLPMAAVDIDMRRAGLDADPGLLPWLGRRLVFAFEGGEA